MMAFITSNYHIQSTVAEIEFQKPTDSEPMTRKRGGVDNYVYVMGSGPSDPYNTRNFQHIMLNMQYSQWARNMGLKRSLIEITPLTKLGNDKIFQTTVHLSIPMRMVMATASLIPVLKTQMIISPVYPTTNIGNGEGKRVMTYHIRMT